MGGRIKGQSCDILTCAQGRGLLQLTIWVSASLNIEYHSFWDYVLFYAEPTEFALHSRSLVPMICLYGWV